MLLGPRSPISFPPEPLGPVLAFCQLGQTLHVGSLHKFCAFMSAEHTFSQLARALRL